MNPNFSEYAEIHLETIKQAFNIELDYDEASILRLDEIIKSGWNGNIPQDLDGVVLLFGSYLGEAMRATLGGGWVEGPSGWEIRIHAGKDVLTVRPFDKIRKRFANGTADSISFFYQGVKKALMERMPVGLDITA